MFTEIPYQQFTTCRGCPHWKLDYPVDGLGLRSERRIGERDECDIGIEYCDRYEQRLGRTDIGGVATRCTKCISEFSRYAKPPFHKDESYLDLPIVHRSISQVKSTTTKWLTWDEFTTLMKKGEVTIER